MSGKSSGEGLEVVSEEAVRTLAASHDRLGLEVDRVCICACPNVPDDWMLDLGRRVSRDVKDLIPDARTAGMKLSYEEGQLLSEFGATVCGLLANAA